MKECEKIYINTFFKNYNFKGKKFLELGAGHKKYAFFNVPLKRGADVTVIENDEKYTKEYAKNINLIKKSYLDVDLEKEHKKYDVLFIKGLPLKAANRIYNYEDKNKLLELVKNIENTLKDDGKGFIWFYINETIADKKGHLDFINEYFQKKNWKIYEFTKNENFHRIVHHRENLPKETKRFLYLKNIEIDLDSISKLKLSHKAVAFL